MSKNQVSRNICDIISVLEVKYSAMWPTDFHLKLSVEHCSDLGTKAEFQDYRKPNRSVIIQVKWPTLHFMWTRTFYQYIIIMPIKIWIVDGR